MNDVREDDRLKAEFRHLRETETDSTPNFKQMLAGRGDAPGVGYSRTGSYLVPGFVAITALLVVTLIVFVNHSPDQTLPQRAEFPAEVFVELERMAVLEMPTDFLLDKPWFELDQINPEFDFEMPNYEFLEELSDET